MQIHHAPDAVPAPTPRSDGPPVPNRPLERPRQVVAVLFLLVGVWYTALAARQAQSRRSDFFGV